VNSIPATPAAAQPPIRNLAGAIRRLVLVLAILLSASPSHGQSVWTGTVDATWNNPGNWNPAGVPSSADAVVTFDATGANTSLTLGGVESVGHVSYDRNQNYLLGGGTLSLATSSGNSTILFGNTSTTYTLASNLSLASDLNLQTTSGNSTLVLSGPFATNDHNLFLTAREPGPCNFPLPSPATAA